MQGIIFLVWNLQVTDGTGRHSTEFWCTNFNLIVPWKILGLPLQFLPFLGTISLTWEMRHCTHPSRAQFLKNFVQNCPGAERFHLQERTHSKEGENANFTEATFFDPTKRMKKFQILLTSSSRSLLRKARVPPRVVLKRQDRTLRDTEISFIFFKEMLRRTTNHSRTRYWMVFLIWWRSHLEEEIQIENWRRNASGPCGCRESMGLIFLNGWSEFSCMQNPSARTIARTDLWGNHKICTCCIGWPSKSQLSSYPNLWVTLNLHKTPLITMRLCTLHWTVLIWRELATQFWKELLTSTATVRCSQNWWGLKVCVHFSICSWVHSRWVMRLKMVKNGFIVP